MKKLAIAVAVLALAATPVFACPHSDSEGGDHAPRTAEKVKDTKSPDQAKPAEKAKDSKETEKAKTAKPEAKPKTTEKVSTK